MAKRKSKIITNQQALEFFYNLTPYECQKLSVNMELFGNFNGSVKYNPYDVIEVPPNTYHNNKNKFTTTIGSWIFNKACIDANDLFDELGYINEPVTKKLYKKLTNKLSYAILEDRVTVQQYKKWIMSLQKFMPYSTILCPTTSEDMLLISNTIAPKKKELLKKYDKELKSGDALVMSKIETELLDYCKEKLKDEPAMDNINSGAGADWGNNFKNMYVIKGAQKDPDPTKGFNIITSCYAEGISREDYPKMANSLAAGPYARACNTAKGGYMEKLFLSAFQHVQLDKKDSDCGTKRTITITLDDIHLQLMMYSYIVEGSKLIRLDSTNVEKYRGKTVKMRFSSLCEHDKICNKCAGDLYYLLDVKNVGAATPQLASCIKNISMKAFHDSTDKYQTMDPMKAFGIK